MHFKAAIKSLSFVPLIFDSSVKKLLIFLSDFALLKYSFEVCVQKKQNQVNFLRRSGLEKQGYQEHNESVKYEKNVLPMKSVKKAKLGKLKEFASEC